MKFGQVIKDNKRKLFLKYHAENEPRKLVPDFFLFFEKALYEIKVVWSLVSIYFYSPQFGIK